MARVADRCRVYCLGRPIHTIRGSFGCLYMRTWTGRLNMGPSRHSAASNASSNGMARIFTPVCQPDSELTPPDPRHNMPVHQLTVVRAWACHLTTPPVFQPLASLPLLEPCGEIGQPLRGPHISDGNGQGTGLPNDHDQLLASGDAGIKQIPSEHGIVLRRQGDHHHWILGPLAFMY